MNFVHTFWTAPLIANKFADSIHTGVAINLTIYALSVECIKSFGHTITLYTDKNGAEMFKPVHYDKVVVVDLDVAESHNFAAAMKFEALKRMDINDILIDGDIILHKKEIYDRISSAGEDVVVSFFEPKDSVEHNFNEQLFNMLREYNFEYPYHTPLYSAIEGWLNTSVMKFNNEQLKREYIEQYEHHAHLINGVDFKQIWPDIVIEQLHLSDLCREHDYSVRRLVSNYPSLEAEKASSDIGFAHIGAMKMHMFKTVCATLERNNPKLASDIAQHIEYITKVFESKR